MNFTWHTNLLYPQFSSGGPNQNTSNYGGLPLYYEDAFLAIQDRISYFYIKILCMHAECQYNTTFPEIKIQRFPYPPYTHDLLQTGLEILIGMFIMLGFLYPMTVTVHFIAVEKEKQLKDVMQIMGMPAWLHITCWFFHTMFFILISITLITFILKVKRILKFSSQKFVFRHSRHKGCCHFKKSMTIVETKSCQFLLNFQK